MVEANHAAPARGNHTSEVRRESPAADRWHKSSDAIFYGVLHAFHGHRQKEQTLDGECYTAAAAAARLDRDATFMDRNPSTLVIHDTKGVPALLLILSHTVSHGMPKAPSALLAVCKWPLQNGSSTKEKKPW